MQCIDIIICLDETTISEAEHKHDHDHDHDEPKVTI